MKPYILVILLLVSSCIQEQPVNKTLPKSCNDTNATNYKKNESCHYEIQSRNCLNQPSNSTKGLEKSYNGGKTWNECEDYSCLTGFEMASNQCIPISPLSNPTIPEIGCNDGYTLIGNSCVVSIQSRSCKNQPLNSKGGLEYTSNGGQDWGLCNNYSCEMNYGLQNGKCIPNPQTRSCYIQNGLGQETSLDGGKNFSACSLKSCNADYIKIANACVLAQQSRSCSISNGIGSQSSIDGGQTYGPCSITSCNSNYSKVQNECIQTIQSRACLTQPSNSYGGIESSLNAGLSWSPCQNFTCDSNYTLVNGVCNSNNDLNISRYKSSFNALASSKGLATTNLSITLSSTLATNTIGLCVFASTRYILINEQWWKASSTTNELRQAVIFHELGHCALNRPHTTQMAPLIDAGKSMAQASLMYPSVINPVIYTNNMSYYHDELFDETLLTENIPLYYYPRTSAKSSISSKINIQTSSMTIIQNEMICGHEELSF